MLVGSVAQVRSYTTRNKRPCVIRSQQVEPASSQTERSKLAKWMRGKSSKVGKGRGVVVIVRTTVDTALNLCETGINFTNVVLNV